MKRLTFLLPCIILMLFGCNSSKDDGMAAHCKDPEFKKAHEIPDSLVFAPKGSMVTFDTPDGKQGSLYKVEAAEASSSYIFVIHEWWGLNDHIKQEAERLAKELGINAFALDMYDGKVATTRDSASLYMQSVQQERAEAIIQGAIGLLGDTDQIATIGWCFGGGWSLNSAILAQDKTKACVIYYGMPTDDISKLETLQSDALGIFAEADKWITPEVVESFEKNMNQAGKEVKNHIYDADHAFANPSSPRYHEASAQAANEVVIQYLKERLQ